ncbi:MAG TPA: hypothetical protein VN689_03520 [Burkholderiales bacterium]|nr:hypothetical protein [Burkholderiales bacterium]
MGIGQKQILEMLRLIEASDYDEINLETDDFKLHVIKSGVQGVKVGDAPASADAVTIAARDASGAARQQLPMSAPRQKPKRSPRG